MIKTLKGKISSIYILLVFLIVIVGTVGVYNMYKLALAVDDLMTDNYKSINAVTYMVEALERQDSAMIMSIYEVSKVDINLYARYNESFLKYYQIEANNLTEKGEKALVEKINKNYNIYTKYFYDFLDFKKLPTFDQKTEYYNRKIVPQFIVLKDILHDLADLNEKAMFRSKQKAIESVKHSMITLFILSIGAVCGGGITARYFVSMFLKPLNILTQRLSNVREGELNQQIPYIANDEFGKLAQEFNNMTKRLLIYEQSTLGNLMTEKNKTMAIVKSISNPMIILDEDYRINLVNNASETFFSVDETKITGKHFLEVVRNGEIFDHISNTVANNLVNSEKIIKIKKDKDYYYNVVVSKIVNPNNTSATLIINFQNVTELKELEKVKTDFIATISHEFKTPLTSIMMAASILLEGGMGVLNIEQHETIANLMDDGDKLTKLVNEILLLTKIESGKAVYKITECSINEIITDVAKEFSAIAQKKDVSLTTEISESLPLVMADFAKIAWVLNNLLSNAIKYTNAGDFIIIKTKRDNDYVHVIVSDTGMGIPTEYIEKVFEQFVHIKDRDIEVRGTGIGLSSAKEIIKSHQGTIWVESEIDSGSSFTFTLPVVKKSRDGELI